MNTPDEVRMRAATMIGAARPHADVSRHQGPLLVEGITRLPQPWLCGEDARNHFRRLAPLVATPGAPLRALGVCSVAAGEGRSWVIAGLACALAERGCPTVVVDVLTTAPVLHDWFGAAREDVMPSEEPGLFSSDIRVARQKRPALPPSSHEAAVQWLRDTTTGHTALVELDPLRDSSQVSTIGPVLDGVLMVVAAERERREVVADAIESLRRRGIALRGVVLNRRRRSLPDILYRWL